MCPKVYNCFCKSYSHPIEADKSSALFSYLYKSSYSVVLLSVAVSFLRRLTSEVIRSKKPGGLVCDICGCKLWTRRACLKAHWYNNYSFCDPFYLSRREQGFRSTNFMISLLWPSALTAEAWDWFEINWINDLSRGEKKQSLAERSSQREEECRKWRNTNQQLSEDGAAGLWSATRAPAALSGCASWRWRVRRCCWAADCSYATSSEQSG